MIGILLLTALGHEQKRKRWRRYQAYLVIASWVLSHDYHDNLAWNALLAVNPLRDLLSDCHLYNSFITPPQRQLLFLLFLLLLVHEEEMRVPASQLEFSNLRCIDLWEFYELLRAYAYKLDV